MDDDKIMEMFVKLMEELHTNTSALKDMLSNHETRITVLEKNKSEGWMSQLLMLLAKALMIGVVSIASLVGAGGLLSKVLGA